MTSGWRTYDIDRQIPPGGSIHHETTAEESGECHEDSNKFEDEAKGVHKMRMGVTKIVMI